MRSFAYLLISLLLASACGQHRSPTGNERLRPLDAGALLPIYEVQGRGEVSPYAGLTISVRGVVVGDFQGDSELRGFFVQELAGDGLAETSDAIFIFHRERDVSVGDEVEVTGRVVEYQGLTELTGVGMDDVVVQSQDHEPQSTPVTLPLASDSSWEQYEGMLVTLKGEEDAPLVAAEVYHLGRGGLVLLADERLQQFTQVNEPSSSGYARHRAELALRSILLDDGSIRQNPDPIPYSSVGDELTADDTLRVGDTAATITGVVSQGTSGWRFSDAYRLHATTEVDFQPTNARMAVPPQVGGRLQVASFNVLNFFNGDGSGGGFPTPRGADSAAELERQLDKLVAAIVPLDAEVLGLIEIENDDGPASALADLVTALNDEAGSGTYAYVDTGVVGSDQIKVAVAYQPAVVQPLGHYRILNSTIDDAWHTSDSRFDDSKNRPALAQLFVERATGARFTVVVNHLKSKGSPCSGDPNEGDGQGNCNRTRTAAAAALADWAELLAKESGDPDILITGDLNAYAMEDPIRELLSSGFDSLLGPSDSTYVFRGEMGTLDHALATASLTEQVTDAAVWNINAEEPSVLDYNVEFKSSRHVQVLYSASPFRSSDHDPVLIGLNLAPSSAP